MARTGEWPTPNATDGKGGVNQRSPEGLARFHGGEDLPTIVALQDWPAATATDAAASGAAGYSTASGRHSGTTLTDATVGPRGPEQRSTDGKPRGRLNPAWVSQLLGFPDGWLSDCSATPSSPGWPK
jgi:hypothetical protein